MEPVIELRDVSYTYPLSKTPSISHVSLKVNAGELCGIIGRNGSGKSTLCMLIRGLVPQLLQGELDGEVFVNGKPTSEYGPGELSYAVGYVLQNPFNQISGVKKTVFEEIAFGLENFGVDPDEIEERVIQVMEMTDVSKLALKNPFELSGGQQQRVAIASVLVLNPSILVIDEPTSQLDPEGSRSIFNIISKLKEEGKTVVLAEHKINELAEFADTIAVLDKGELAAFGPSSAVLSDKGLVSHGVRMPQVAMLCEKLRCRGLSIPRLPTTREEATKTIRAALERA